MTDEDLELIVGKLLARGRVAGRGGGAGRAESGTWR